MLALTTASAQPTPFDGAASNNTWLADVEGWRAEAAIENEQAKGYMTAAWAKWEEADRLFTDAEPIHEHAQRLMAAAEGMLEEREAMEADVRADRVVRDAMRATLDALEAMDSGILAFFLASHAVQEAMGLVRARADELIRVIEEAEVVFKWKWGAQQQASFRGEMVAQKRVVEATLIDLDADVDAIMKAKAEAKEMRLLRKQVMEKLKKSGPI